MKRSGTYFLVSIFFVIFLGIASVGFIAQRNSDAYQKTAAQIEVTDQILTEADMIDALDEANETAVQSYLVSNNPKVLELAMKDKESISEHIQDLKNLVHNNREQLPKIDSLESSLHRKEALFDSALVLKKNKGAEAALLFIAAGEERNIIKNSGRYIASIETTQRNSLQHHKKANEAAIGKFNRLFWLLIIIPLSLLVLCFFAINQAFSERKRREDQILKFNEALEARIEERTGELRESEASIKAIINNTDIGYVLIDASLKIVSFNVQAEKFVVQSLLRPLVSGTFFAEYFPEDRRQPRMEMMQNALRGTDVAYESQYLQPDDTKVWYDIKMFNVTDENGKVLGVTMSVTDITKRKLSELEITSLNESLEKRVMERTAQLQETNKELESFSYMVSHDLRAPLRVIDGFGRMMLKTDSDRLSVDAKNCLDVILTNVKQLGQLIDDLLKFSRLGKSSLSQNHVNMGDMVKAVIEEVKAADPNTKAGFELHGLMDVQCDPVLMKQVWVNLISNAVKYSRKKDQPVVEIGTIGENGSTAYYVKDNGAGFDMAHSKKLFGVFQRLHKVTEYEGTGVGLALVHRIVSKHGGKIWAEAAVNEGATFYFTLPH